MFATLLGGLPRPTGDEAADVDALVLAAIRAQEAAGLEPITDGRLRDPDFDGLAARMTSAVTGSAGLKGVGRDVDRTSPVASWRLASAQTRRAVKQALPGPYTLGRRLQLDVDGMASADRSWIVDELRREIEALVAAGCPMIEIEELDAHLIRDDDAERRRFSEAHNRLTHGVRGTHLSLSIVGGSAASAGAETILGGTYASFAFDLISGPDNWNLATRLPGDRGVIAGALSAREARDEPKEVMLWAAHYAASGGGRGLDRVGLGSAGSYANLTWEAAVRKMRLLGDAARLATLPAGEELARSVDPASVSARRAALGHDRAASGRDRARRQPPR